MIGWDESGCGGKGWGELAVAREIVVCPRNSASYSGAGGTYVELGAAVAEKKFGADALESLAARYKAAKSERKQEE